MTTRYGFMDPGAIMGVVVSLIILGIGVFAFFVTINSIPYSAYGAMDSAGTNATRETIRGAINNTTGSGNQVFNIIGIVIIIGAIMSIVGLVYQYVR